MKKMLIFITCCFVLITAAHAQNAEEVFQQKKTQKKYLLRQIAALQVYIQFLQKGYGIARDGLTLIGDIKDGEFGLHKGYFRSLGSVSPTIRSYGRINEVTSLQKRIADISRDSYRKARKSGAFTEEELRYIRRVHERLLDDCSHTLDELLAVTADSKLQMTDDGRMSRIDNLYARMQDQYAFLKSFDDETMALAASRMKSEKDIKISRTINGLSTR
jgi:hypothetical protein